MGAKLKLYNKYKLQFYVKHLYISQTHLLFPQACAAVCPQVCKCLSEQKSVQTEFTLVKTPPVKESEIGHSQVHIPHPRLNTSRASLPLHLRTGGKGSRDDRETTADFLLHLE